MGSTGLHGVAELNCTNKQNYTIHGVGSADLHGVAELNCTNKQNYTIHGVGSTDLHGVAELNCTNKQNIMQNQTAQISKQYTEPNCTNKKNTQIHQCTLSTIPTLQPQNNSTQHNTTQFNQSDTWDMLAENDQASDEVEVDDAAMCITNQSIYYFMPRSHWDAPRWYMWCVWMMSSNDLKSINYSKRSI